MLEIQKQNKEKKLSVASELAFKVACLYKKRVKGGIRDVEKVSCIYVFIEQPVWHLQPSFFSGLSLSAVGREEAGRTKQCREGVRETASLWKLKEDLLPLQGEDWIILSMFRITKIHVFF